MRIARFLFPFVLAWQMCPGVFGQEVVSARSGMVHFTQGQVFLDDHQLDRKSGSFPGIKEGSTLRTEKGRAEVLLTPGAFLRLDENSSIRMVSTELADTRLVFVGGSAILDLSEARANNAITVTYKDARARFPQKGVYRLDADTGVLQAYSGEATVDYDGKQTRVDPSHLFFCWLGLETNKLGSGTEDEFYDWASDRSQAISDENQLAEQTLRDPGDADPDPGAQLGGGVPYLGAPGLAPPSIGTPSYPAPSYRTYPYSTYSMGSTMFNPFLSFAPTPYVPLGYQILILGRRYNGTRAQWPRTANSNGALWHRVTVGSATLPTHVPTRIGMPGPVVGFRPAPVHIPAGVPVGGVARPSGPIAAHAVGAAHPVSRR